MYLDDKSYKVLKIIQQSVQVRAEGISERTGLTCEKVQKYLIDEQAEF
jgi:hypothetical protein